VNFFAAQDQARRSSRRLVFAYIVATIAIVLGVTTVVGFALFNFSQAGYGYTPVEFIQHQTPLLAGTALLTVVFVLGASLYKTALLSSGGKRVAVDMGGTLVATDVQDPLRRRLRNVVEEMAIASGVPVPEIYVLEEEQGINAFAAGYAPSDAAIAVTRGTLELLDRDELQGVIAHEFSHILNGDMKLNIRLMGVLFGIMVLALIGRLIVRGGYHANILSSSRNRGAPVALIIGLGLIILGGIGIFFARAIKASISRQREYLADASAVQFTRQSTGIANALKKIGGYGAGSLIRSKDPEEVSHMLFGTGARLSGMFATHPPLVKRIQALDPSFKEADFPRVDPRHRQSVTAAEGRHTAFAGDGTTAFSSSSAIAARNSGDATANAIAETIGQPKIEHVEYAKFLRQSLPESLYDAAHSSELAYLLTIALVLDRSGKHVERQLSLAQEQLGAQRAQLIRRYYNELAKAGAEYRLPLLEIAFPALKLRPPQELAYVISMIGRMIEIDDEVDLYEYCFYRILTSSLEQATDPSGRRGVRHPRRRDLRAATINLLRIIANYGHESDADREASFQCGLATLGPWAQQQDYAHERKTTAAVLDHSLDVLLGLNSNGKESLFRAISTTAAFDGKLDLAEAELLRAICATLNYPLPPILMHRVTS